jgi:hypothetical protein
MQVPFPITTYTDIEGRPLVNGYLLIQLSQDAYVSPTTVLCSLSTVKVLLNDLGVITGDYEFWPNSELTPPNTYYTLRAYSSAGQLVLGPLYVTVSGIIVSSLVLIDTVSGSPYTVFIANGQLMVAAGGTGGVDSLVLIDTATTDLFSLVVTSGNLTLNSGGSGGVTAVDFIDTITSLEYSLVVTNGNMVVTEV